MVFLWCHIWNYKQCEIHYAKIRINTGFFKKVKHHFPITQFICFWGFYLFLGKSGRFWGNFFVLGMYRQSKNKWSLAHTYRWYAYLGYAAFITLFVPFVVHAVATKGKEIWRIKSWTENPPLIRMAGSSGDFVKVHKNIINILLNIPDRQHIFFLILLHTVIK